MPRAQNSGPFGLMTGEKKLLLGINFVNEKNSICRMTDQSVKGARNHLNKIGRENLK